MERSKRNIFVSVVSAACLAAVLFCGGVEVNAVGVDATDISGVSYTESVLKELDLAKESIYVAMYTMYARYGERESAVYKLVEALIRASKRGVYVRVYLDKSPVVGNDIRRLNKANEDAYKMLQEGGVEVYFIKPQLKLHSKLIVIDEETVIDGSANWTEKAFSENKESAEILRGKEFARLKLAQIGELEKYAVTPEAPKKALLEKVRIRNSFLEDSRFGPRMVTDSDEHSFDLYLILLREFKEKRNTYIEIDYVKTAKMLGIRVDTGQGSYRRDIRWVVNNLKEKYGLIAYNIDEKGSLRVGLLDYDYPSKEYSAPKSGYFNVPIAYWEYGLDKELELREKFAYMIAIYEGEIARPREWWHRSLVGLSEKYHIDEWTLSYGLRGVRKLDLLEVRYSRVKGEDYADRKPNEYRLKKLISPYEKEKMWKELEDAYGQDLVKTARGYGTMIDEGNNVQAVRDFIRLIKTYKRENVEEAVKIASELGADNPLRSINYIVGILKRMERER